jgi:hypothetical protein
MFSCSVVSKPPEIRAVFGVRVSLQTNSQVISIVGFIDNGRILTHKRILTKDDFVRFASGFWPSIYNPERINLFEQHNLLCGMFRDSTTDIQYPYCFPVDSLWKIRFSDYPFNTSFETGWSNETRKPSPKQAEYLWKNYGVYNIDLNYFLDTNFWKILRDVQDPLWVSNYRSLL